MKYEERGSFGGVGEREEGRARGERGRVRVCECGGEREDDGEGRGRGKTWGEADGERGKAVRGGAVLRILC